MTKKKFMILVLIAFFGAFLWAGGNLLLPKSLRNMNQNMSQLTNVTTNLTKSIHTNEAVQTTTNFYQRVHRILLLKGAVETKLDRQSYVKINDIPLSFQQAVIAVEDNRFYHHYGFDVESLLRATLVNMQTGAYTEGGSTITQQLVKNLFLNQDKNFGRKIEEFILAVDMELHYSKEEILEMYVNTIYFGSGSYGIKAASNNYFNKEPAELTLAQSTLLAGVPNAPSLYSPFVDLAAAKQRQAVVLSLMARNNYIGPSLAAEALDAPLRLAKQ
jgi:membrane peptidoglycan carboxypeptidase